MILAHPQNKLEKELVKIFHSSNLPLYFNKTGNKEFTNYQRISLIILLRRSKKSLRDFIEELRESRWTSWLGLKKIPGKSTLHDWINLFKMKTIRELFSIIKPKNSKLATVDGTGFDGWQRSRQYAKRIGEPPMPYAKVDLFIDVKKRMIIDFDLKMGKEHDVKVAERMFKRTSLKNITILGDGAYDSEHLHELVRSKGGKLYAPVRKKSKKGLIRKRPKGIYRRECVELPEFMGQRSIVESINFSLKKKQIVALTCRKDYLKKREFAWHAIFYNLRMIVKEKNKVPKETEVNFIFWLMEI